MPIPPNKYMIEIHKETAVEYDHDLDLDLDEHVSILFAVHKVYRVLTFVI